MRLARVAALVLALASQVPVAATAASNVGHPFPGLSSECTPAVPGIECMTPDPAGLGRVEMYSGEYILEEDDLRIPGRGFDFVMRRTYRTKGERVTRTYHDAPQWERPSSPLGTGWTHSYDIWLESYEEEVSVGCTKAYDPDLGMWVDQKTPVSFIRIHMGNGRTQSLGRQVSRTFHNGALHDPGGQNWYAQGVSHCEDPWNGGYMVSPFSNTGQWMFATEDLPDDRVNPTDLGGFTVTFADGSRWHFKTYYRAPADYCHGCVGTPPPIERPSWQDRFRAVCDWIEDPNGNRMYLEYHVPEPRWPIGDTTPPWLTSVVDTLGRRIDFGYQVTPRFDFEGNPDGELVNLKSVTDWTGRSVRYTHEDTTLGPGTGQLSGVMRPAVTGTPLLDDGDPLSGNDHPESVRRRYVWRSDRPWLLSEIRDLNDEELVRLEYSTGTVDFVDARLPSGYCPCADETGWYHCANETADWNRVTRHVIAGQSMWFDYVRLPDLTPPHFGAVYCGQREMLRCTMTDAMGNVTVSHFNRSNLVSRRREYVGRAASGGPARTTVGASGEVIFTSNPPVGPLRGVDPVQVPGLSSEAGHWFYETVHQYHPQGLPKTVYAPNATARPGYLGSAPRTTYIYVPGLGDCSADPDDLPSCTFGPLACTRSMPRHVVRRTSDDAPLSERECLGSESLYESDEMYGIRQDIRPDIEFTEHPGEPRYEFEHDDQGNLRFKFLRQVGPTPRIEIERWEYEDISVPDALAPGGERLVRRLKAHVHPPHQVAGVEVRQRDEYVYYGDAECPDPGASANPFCAMRGFVKSFTEDVAASSGRPPTSTTASAASC